MIRITAKKAGFRRAGLAHPGAPTEYPAGTFTPEQLAALKAEPMLVVEEIEDEGGEDDAPAPTGKAKKTGKKTTTDTPTADAPEAGTDTATSGPAEGAAE